MRLAESRAHFTFWIAALAAVGCTTSSPPRVALESIPPHTSSSELQIANANDNRVPAGVLRNGVLTISIDAVTAAWKPDLTVDTLATIQAFAERGRAPSVPGPLIRVPHGTEIRATLRNTLSDSTLIVHGLKTGTRVTDTIQLAPGQSREVSFTPAEPGTYFYWGTTSRSTIRDRWGREQLLNGAIIVDPPGAPAIPNDRIFVLSLIDIYPDSIRNPRKEDVWEVTINGRSWPHTERLQHSVGDTVRWRFINATDRVHPMHLHGFHFRTLAKGDWLRDTTYTAASVAHAVTEFMTPGSTASIDWTPTRAGNWLMHCHMIPHITPYPERPDTLRAHDSHDVMTHPEKSMAGLVLGITTTERAAVVSKSADPPKHRHRLFVQQGRADSGKKAARGYVLQRDSEPRRDSVEVPGSVLVLYRGEKTAVTVLNRLPQPTTVHWHGMELESVFDGVSGWSGMNATRAPLVMPDDSFTVSFTPPRAGTYIYHTHMDEEEQLRAGLYGPMLVLEPGERFDPSSDLVFMIAQAVEKGKTEITLNGATKPAALTLDQGKRYRLRFVNVLDAPPAAFQLLRDSTPVIWRAISKDGAALPAPRATNRPATTTIGVGETYDFEWTPQWPGDFRITVTGPGRVTFQIVQPLRVRARPISVDTRQNLKR